MTRSGPEPVGSRTAGAISGVAGLDYDHYVERQLLPIAASIADALGYDARSWMALSPQIELDFGP
jgi:DNA polymerase elongation subunit (family B)